MKGVVDGMTKKRFVSEDNCCGYYTEIIDNEKELDLSLPNPKKNLTIEELVDLLNELDKKYSQLKKENEQLKEQIEELYQKIDFLTHFIEKQGFKVKG